MEVGIRLGVYKYSPAEAISPENGWRSSQSPILGRRGNDDFYLKESRSFDE